MGSNYGGRGLVRGYGPVRGDLGRDCRSGEAGCMSPHSGGVLEADSRAACPPPDRRQGPAVKGPDWSPPAMPC